MHIDDDVYLPAICLSFHLNGRKKTADLTSTPEIYGFLSISYK